MKIRPTAERARARRGFTLAEVAVTIVIVGIALTLVLQGLNAAKLRAAHTHHTKLARDLGLLTLGQIEGGVYQEDLEDDLLEFTYEDYPDFYCEIALGDEPFRDEYEDEYDPSRPYDSWAPTPEEEEEKEDRDEDAAEPYQKVKVRISFPKIQELSSSVVLERWIPWEQVYGKKDEKEGTR